MSTSTRREGESSQGPITKISRRTFLEYTAAIGGVLTATAASIDAVNADISINYELINDKKIPQLNAQAHDIRAQIAPLADVPEPSAEQKLAIQTGIAFADAVEAYNQERNQIKSELWAQSKDAQIIGTVTRGNLRHWAFLGGLAASVVGITSNGRHIDKLITRVKTILKKS